MFTPTQLNSYRRTGLLRVPSAFSSEDAATIVRRAWSILTAKFGAQPDDPATWQIQMGYGFGELKHDPLFARVGSPRTIQAIDGLLGELQWVRPSNWGQLLVTFPEPGKRWTVPTKIWHTDFGFLPASEPFGVMVFGFLTEVQPEGGGTVVIEGSHQLVQRFVARQPRERLTKMKQVRLALLDSQPWLRDLASAGDDQQRRQRFTQPEEVEGIPVRVIELTGAPGDLVLCHPWMIHAVAPNCSQRPRMMFVQRIHARTD